MIGPITIKIYLRHVVTIPEIHASLGEKGQVTQEQSLHPPIFLHRNSEKNPSQLLSVKI